MTHYRDLTDEEGAVIAWRVSQRVTKIVQDLRAEFGQDLCAFAGLVMIEAGELIRQEQGLAASLTVTDAVRLQMGKHQLLEEGFLTGDETEH